MMDCQICFLAYIIEAPIYWLPNIFKST